MGDSGTARTLNDLIERHYHLHNADGECYGDARQPGRFKEMIRDLNDMDPEVGLSEIVLPYCTGACTPARIKEPCPRNDAPLPTIRIEGGPVLQLHST